MQSKKNWYNLNKHTRHLDTMGKRKSIEESIQVLVMAASRLLFSYKSFHVQPGWDQQSLKKITVFCELGHMASCYQYPPFPFIYGIIGILDREPNSL